MDDNGRLLFACALSLLIFVAFDYFYSPGKNPPPGVVSQGALESESGGLDIPIPDIENTAIDHALQKATPEVLGKSGPAPRIAISTPQLEGSLSLRGAVIDDLVLRRYHQTIEDDSPPVRLLHRRGSPNAYYLRQGWTSLAKGYVMPGADTLWQTTDHTLGVNQPVTLSWRSPQGLLFEQTIHVDDQFLFTVTSKVINHSKNTVAVSSYGLVSRRSAPKTQGFFILHEGPLGYLDGQLREYSYGDLRDDSSVSLKSQGGWLGITDKYWLSALIPDSETPIGARFLYLPKTDVYQSDYIGPIHSLAANGEVSVTSHMFIGAKVVSILDRYQDTIGADHLDLAVDFGWFYFLTKPIFYALDWLSLFFGNFGLGILALTVVSRILLYPIANKSFETMNRMRHLQPKVLALRERLANDRPAMSREMMALYQKHKINPAAGCLPIIIQIPIFFCLYKVLFVTIEMRHAPFYGWISDLSAMDPTNLFTAFGLLSWSAPSWLHIGIWPLLMGASMFLQQKLNPPPPDPIQARIFMFLPIVFTVIMASFPAGLVIYWTWNNVLSILQQWWLMRKMDAAQEAQAAAQKTQAAALKNTRGGAKKSKRR